MAHAPDTSSPTLRFDIIAGLTASAVVLPKAMAYATVAGLSVSVGLYTAFVPMIVYALLGTSRVLSVSSTTTLAILSGAQLGLAVPDGDPGKLMTAAATLTALTGAFLIAASVLRLGFVANFISIPVLTGFKAGIGMVIVLDQVPKLFGIHITKEGFFRDILSVVRHLPETSMITLAIAVVTLLALLAMERLKPHSPAPLAAVGAGIAASWFFGLSALGVSTVGAIPQSLPPITLPSLDLVQQLWPGALGIALMSFTETMAVGRAFARETDPPIKANRELLATGAANLSGAFFGAMPAGGGASQTLVVRSVGGRTQMASLVTAATAAATMLFLAPLLGLPAACGLGSHRHCLFGRTDQSRRVRVDPQNPDNGIHLGACGPCRRSGVRHIAGHRPGDHAVARRACPAKPANPKVYVIGRKRGDDVLRPVSPEHPDDETFDGLLILRPEGACSSPMPSWWAIRSGARRPASSDACSHSI